MEKTVYELILDCLKESGIDAYPPEVKTGECTSNYVVVKDAGSTQFGNFSSDIVYYNVLCYVPKKKYTSLQRYVKEVQLALEKVYPMLEYANSKSAPYYNDEIKAHMQRIEYINHVKL